MAERRYDAVVVGAGPNGLAAAVTLARAGRAVVVFEAGATVGGGTRSAELTLPGFTHDVCSAIHPLGVGSPVLQRLPLAAHGLEWVHPQVPLAHPLGNRAIVLRRSVAATAEGLGRDGRAYARLMSPIVAAWDDLVAHLAQPLRIPRRPLALTGFGAQAAMPARALLSSWFRGEGARALLAGCAAHAIQPLERPFTGVFALLLAVAGHAVGWPLPRGGSQRIADALAGHLRQLGGEIVTGRRIASIDELPAARAVLLDVTGGQLLAMAGHRLPARERRRLARYRYGPGVYKVDYALDGPVPWVAPECAQAGTVHLGGTLAEIAAAERDVARGRHPERPFVLVAQQSLFDPSRAPAGQHTLWAYCHVPNGSTVDMSAAIEGQIERFAPGFRDRVLARSVRSTADLEHDNPNAVGGDIAGGALTPVQLITRWARPWPYATGVDGLYVCSSSTPPGPGVHGLCGYHAARAVLRAMRGSAPLHRG